MNNTVLVERVFSRKEASFTRQAMLIVLGVVALVVAAKVQVHVWPSPVPVTLGTLAVLTVGATYGARLGLVTVLAYLALGATGAAVFAGSSAGLEYMLGATGGYLVGYALAAGLLGFAARSGFDRNVLNLVPVLLVANALIYVPGVLWLRLFAESWSQTLAWGLTPFLIGDAIKLGLAALLLPLGWKVLERFAPET